MQRHHLKNIARKKRELKKHPHLQKALGKLLHEPSFWRLQRESVARGSAAGLLVAFIPLPVQTILSIVIAMAIRGNIFIAVAMTWISNPFTFVPINLLIYETGKLFVEKGYGHTHLVELSLSNLSWQQFILWIKSMGLPFLIGLPIFSFLSAITGYILVQVVGYFFALIKRV